MINYGDKPNASRISHTHEWLWSMINCRAHYLLDQYGELDLYCSLKSWDTGDCSDAGLIGVLFEYLISLTDNQEVKEYWIDTMKQYVRRCEQQELKGTTK